MRSVTTTLAVLDTVADHQPVGVGELARVMGLPKSTVQRSLAVLADSGWIRSFATTGHTRWVLSAKPLSLAGRVIENRGPLRAAAAPVMRELARATDETIHLTIPETDAVVLLDKVDSTQAVRTISWIGGRTPIHAASSGLAMLAHQGPEIVRNLNLARYTDTTITDPATLESRLAEIRRRGYAVNIGMWRDDMSAVGAAVLDADGVAVAALSISMPTYRLTPDKHEPYGRLVHRAALEVAEIQSGTGRG